MQMFLLCFVVVERFFRGVWNSFKEFLKLFVLCSSEMPSSNRVNRSRLFQQPCAGAALAAAAVVLQRYDCCCCCCCCCPPASSTTDSSPSPLTHTHSFDSHPSPLTPHTLLRQAVLHTDSHTLLRQALRVHSLLSLSFSRYFPGNLP